MCLKFRLNASKRSSKSILLSPQPLFTAHWRFPFSSASPGQFINFITKWCFSGRRFRNTFSEIRVDYTLLKELSHSALISASGKVASNPQKHSNHRGSLPDSETVCSDEWSHPRSLKNLYSSLSLRLYQRFAVVSRPAPVAPRNFKKHMQLLGTATNYIIPPRKYCHSGGKLSSFSKSDCCDGLDVQGDAFSHLRDLALSALLFS